MYCGKLSTQYFQTFVFWKIIKNFHTDILYDIKKQKNNEPIVC